ncbi:hypothetical protein Tco_0951801 [Tanacetum coccineum]|uniref:Uncharacterized protein n=1 Tax=Tanacetum coccineum TaxID=301880 RepID=A0ABQ5DV71_9ASTR
MLSDADSVRKCQSVIAEVNSNTTPNSTNMSHRGGEIDQDAEQDQVKSSLLKAEFLKMNDMRTYLNLSAGLMEFKSDDIKPMSSVHISSVLALQRQMASAENTLGPKDYEILFQLLFDEYFNPPPRAVSPDPVTVAAPRAVDPADSPSSTTID